MNKQALLKDLTELANNLDKQGKYKVASAVDKIIQKNAGDMAPQNVAGKIFDLLGVAYTRALQIYDATNKSETLTQRGKAANELYLKDLLRKLEDEPDNKVLYTNGKVDKDKVIEFALTLNTVARGAENIIVFPSVEEQAHLQLNSMLRAFKSAYSMARKLKMRDEQDSARAMSIKELREELDGERNE